MNILYNQPTTKHISFSAMKKNQFYGTDFAVVEKFKAPIEKFDNNDDFQAWAGHKYIEVYLKDYNAKSTKVSLERQEKISEWNFLLRKNQDYTNAEKFIIMNAITKDLKPNNNVICPTLNKEVLNNTINELRTKLAEDRYYQYNFGEMYRTNISAYYKEKSKIDENTCQWIIIPSKEHDPENFNDNVEKLKNISDRTWCTRNGGGGAKLYLEGGDFHLYLEKGKPKLAIRFDEDEIREIQSEKNDFIIPAQYMDILEDKLDELDTTLSSKASLVLNNSRALKVAEEEMLAENNITEINNNTNQSQEQKGFFNFLSRFFKKKNK